MPCGPLSGASACLLTKQFSSGLKEPLAAGLGCRARVSSLLPLQICQVSLAVEALDDLEMKPDICRQLRIKGVEQVASKLLTAGASEPATMPDCSESVKVNIRAVMTNVL